MNDKEFITLGKLKKKDYILSNQAKWTKEKIKEKLNGYKKISFENLLENKDIYIGTIVRYFKGELFRSGGIMTKIEVVKENPLVGYVGFKSVAPPARWTAQSKTSTFWVQEEPQKPNKKKLSKEEMDRIEKENKKKNIIKEIRDKWFTHSVKVRGGKKGEEKIYIVFDIHTGQISQSNKASNVKTPDDIIVSARVVYERVKNGNKKAYKRKYFVSRLNKNGVNDLEKYLSKNDFTS